MKTTMNSKSGFTLIEVIAVLVLLGILAAVAVPRYIDLADSAAERAIDAAIAELNGREAVAWADQMLSTSGGPVVDGDIQDLVIGDGSGNFDANALGGDYVLGEENAGTAYTITFQGGSSYDLSRTAAGTAPGNWENDGLTTP